MNRLVTLLLAALLALAPTLPARADIHDWSTIPAANTSLEGISWAEGMAPGSVDNGIRAIAAAIRAGVANKGDDIASASTIDLGAATGQFVDITGTTTITSLGTVAAGVMRWVRFTGSLTLTHDNTSLILLNNGNNIATDAGDIAAFVSLGSGNWQQLYYQRADGTPLVGDTNDLEQGTHTVWVPAGAMVARATNGCATGSTETSSNKVMLVTKDCDSATAEGVQFGIGMPESWDEDDVRYQVYWTAGVTGGVTWTLSCVAIGDDDALDAAFGTAVDVEDTVTAAGDLMATAISDPVTCAGSPAPGDWVVFQLVRDVTDDNDDAAGDVSILGVKVLMTLDAPTDD